MTLYTCRFFIITVIRSTDYPPTKHTTIHFWYLCHYTFVRRWPCVSIGCATRLVWRRSAGQFSYPAFLARLSYWTCILYFLPKIKNHVGAVFLSHCIGQALSLRTFARTNLWICIFMVGLCIPSVATYVSIWLCVAQSEYFLVWTWSLRVRYCWIKQTFMCLSFELVCILSHGIFISCRTVLRDGFRRWDSYGTWYNASQFGCVWECDYPFGPGNQECQCTAAWPCTLSW